ncbi:tetratricopeptide repeat protein [Hyphobacterium sp. SN044]|uniref:NfrA family protein n=1 Tax=Hyphobacterium sp. SN044 TaxID=2912575 RepID=UPI001F3F196B|nr:tetratricopeptide repeat protein [Hyphobacterium sp. SN044]MCF8878604.1 tetratricopeptide repeat protein [Hyphobacterium sp. SN044]
MSKTLKPRRHRRLLLATSALIFGLAAWPAGAELDPAELEALRIRAVELANSNRCGEALPMLESVANSSRSAIDWMVAAECAVQEGQSERAADAYWQAVTYRDQLPEAQALNAMRGLGYQSEAARQTTRALIGWEAASRLSGLASDRLMAARAARLDNRPGQAMARLNAIDPNDLNDAPLALYFEEKARSMADAQPDAAALYWERAVAIEDAPYRQYELGLLYDRLDRPVEARRAFDAALAGDPDNVTIVLSAAYAARRGGQDARAAELFRRALRLDPSRNEVREDLGYALIAAGDRQGAAGAFRAAIDNGAGQGEADETHLYRLRREIEQLERSTYGYAFAGYRSEQAIPNPLQQGASETQIGAEAGWRPDALRDLGGGVTIYGRGYVSTEPGTFDLNEDTLQFGAGARWRPFRDHDFNVSAERLIAGGDLARDAWLLRASYGWTDGYDWNPSRDSWNYTALYADVSYIPDSPEFLSAYASARQGRRFRIADRWAVTPYVVAVAQATDDSFTTRERFEAGPGVSFSYWFDEDRYTAPRKRVDFELEYRESLAGDGDDAVIGRVVWSF